MKTRWQIILALISGILVCFSFPTVLFGWHAPEMGIIGWVALVPLFLAIRKASPRRAFLLTFISSLVWYGTSVYWVYRAMHTYGHLPSYTSAIVTVLLIVILAVYISLAPLIARFVSTRRGTEMILILPTAWVAVEFCRNYIPFNGFPWSNIAMSQYSVGPVLQAVDIAGIYGLIFLMVFVNQFLAELIARLMGERINTIVEKGVVTTVLLIALLVYGFYRIKTVPYQLNKHEPLTVGMIQGNIDQSEKWDKAMAEKNINIYRMKARQLRNVPVDLIVWPEAAFPEVLSSELTSIDPRILGLDSMEYTSQPYTLIGAVSKTPQGYYYNSSYLFDAHGRPAGIYHKSHLVPFGEYVPYSKLLFFAKKLTEPVGNFLPGESFAPLSFDDKKVGILICYEDIFPEISRKSVQRGATFLANLTNDAWYGVSSAPYQHLALSVFRAVENRRFLIRSTNTGVTAVIDPVGRIIMRSQIFVPSVMISAIAPVTYLSLYTKLGDWLAWGCSIYVLIMLAATFALRFKRSVRQ